MPNRKLSMGVAVNAKLLAVTLLAISCQANAEAEKFCDTFEVAEKLWEKYHYKEVSEDKLEEMVRKKCHAGDVIWIENIQNGGGSHNKMTARLCDFKFHIDEHVCILASPRETY